MEPCVLRAKRMLFEFVYSVDIFLVSRLFVPKPQCEDSKSEELNSTPNTDTGTAQYQPSVDIHSALALSM